METLVPGRMPRTGFMLMLLLLCFVPETAGTINPDSLKVIVDYVNKRGGVAPQQYAFAVILPHDVCMNPQQGLNQALNSTNFTEMKSTLSQNGSLYNPNYGNIVAARPKYVVTPTENYTEHSEWRLLHGPNNPVAQLKNRTGPILVQICLIFFTYNSPCSTKCLRQRGRSNIVQMTRRAFSAIGNNDKAFVFQKIFHYDMENVSRWDLLQAWHRLRDVHLLRCDNNGCHDCAGNDTTNHPCLAGKRWTKEPGQEPRGARSATGPPRCACVSGTLTNRRTSQLGTKLPSRTPFLCPCTLI